MIFTRLSVFIGSTLIWPAIASAVTQPTLQGDKFHITEAERTACRDDAVNLCLDAYPSEDLLLACMKAKRDQLSQSCRVTFESGLRRRHLPID